MIALAQNTNRVLEYVELEAAKSIDGLRLVLSRGVPGPWGQAAKAIFRVRGVPFTPVAQEPGEENAALKAWAGSTSAPIALYRSEPPRSGWTEILMLAERLGEGPSLIPADEDERALMFGLAHALCSEDGFGWNRRLIMMSKWRRAVEKTNNAGDAGSKNLETLRAKYEYGRDEQLARERINSILRTLSAQLQRQAALGSPFFIGRALSALDIYWACFSILVRPLPEDVCAMGAGNRAAYTEKDPETLAAADAILFEHRDRIYETYFELPLRF